MKHHLFCLELARLGGNNPYCSAVLVGLKEAPPPPPEATHTEHAENILPSAPSLHPTPVTADVTVSNMWPTLRAPDVASVSCQSYQNFLPGICASVSTGRPERWCVGGPQSPAGSAPIRLRWALDGSGEFSPFPPFCAVPCSPQ